jgi:hypothetical protein
VSLAMCPFLACMCVSGGVWDFVVVSLAMCPFLTCMCVSGGVWDPGVVSLAMCPFLTCRALLALFGACALGPPATGLQRTGLRIGSLTMETPAFVEWVTRSRAARPESLHCVVLACPDTIDLGEALIATARVPRVYCFGACEADLPQAFVRSALCVRYAVAVYAANNSERFVLSGKLFTSHPPCRCVLPRWGGFVRRRTVRWTKPLP